MKEIKFSVSLFGRDSKRISKNSLGLNILQGRLNTVSKKLQDMPISVGLASGPSINKLSDTFAKKYQESIRDNFIHNPSSWKHLSQSAMEIRRMLIDPKFLAQEIKSIVLSPENRKKGSRTGLFSDNNINKLIREMLPRLSNRKGLSERQVIERFKSRHGLSQAQLNERIDAFVGGLRPPPLHPNMMVNGPALLTTGRLMNSIIVKLEKSDSKVGKTLTRFRDFLISYENYGNKHFLGKSFVVPTLYILNNKGDILGTVKIPIYYARKLGKLDLSPLFKVEVRNESVKVAPRDPFILKEKDMQLINKFGDEAWIPFTKAAQQKILEIQGLL